jgi:hypothetical protein
MLARSPLATVLVGVLARHWVSLKRTGMIAIWRNLEYIASIARC